MADPLQQLLELDERGFLMPPGESFELFTEQARDTLRWADRVRESLSTRGEAEVLGEVVPAAAAVPREVLEEGLRPARQTYRISPLWVPAFYSNRYLPWYVGGAMFFDPSARPFQVCLVLRKGFRRSQRWLIYDRTEIISHELCHVARGEMNQNVFEEALAYRLSGSRFRRLTGGVFRGRWEAPALLGGAAFLAAAGVGEMFGASPWLKLPGAAALAGVMGGLAWRAVRDGRHLRRAAAVLQPTFGDSAEAVLFRCTDREICALGRLSPRQVEKWIDDRDEDVRWRLIKQRFLP